MAQHRPLTQWPLPPKTRVERWWDNLTDAERGLIFEKAKSEMEIANGDLIVNEKVVRIFDTEEQLQTARRRAEVWTSIINKF
jgi:hypothetical protein